MSIASSLPEDGDEIHGPGLPKRIRLSDVGHIAAERLEGVANGSLKEALALRDPSPTPEDAQAERIGSGPAVTPAAEETHSQPGSRSDTAAAETWAFDSAAGGGPVEPARAVAALESAPEVPDSTSATDTSEVPATAGTDERADEPPDLAVMATGNGAESPSAPPVLPLSPDGPAAETGAQLADDRPDAEPPGPGSQAHAAEPAAAVESTAFIAPPLFTAEPTPAAQSFAEPYGAANPQQAAAETGDGATPSPAADPKLASALGAAAKLAADATAAAEAIDNLKRLLERQLPQPGEAAQSPLHELFGEAAASAAPPPLPQHEPIGQAEEDEPRAAPAKPLPRPAPREAAWRESRQFDVRGFMAGFALSWAIGAALYIYLSAG
jgi:hypothetical protein